MTGATRLAALLTAALAVWLAALFHTAWLGPAAQPPPWLADIIPSLPLWALVTFGAYALGSIGWGLFTFGDCPDAHADLVKEIAAAKKDLRAHGLSI